MSYYHHQYCPDNHPNLTVITNPSHSDFYNDNNLNQAPLNRFIYVKQSFDPSPPVISNSTKVLVNPHFKKKVYVNPQFNLQQNPLSAQPPKIHVNPNVLIRLKTTKQFQPEPNKPIAEEKKTTVISTRNKLLRVPVTCGDINPIQNRPTRKRQNSIHTKYKIIRSSNTSTLMSPGINRNKFKLDKRPRTKQEIIKTANIGKHNIKKRYVYINRFLSISIMAKNVLLKQNCNLKKPGFVNINGILYKKSPNSLKKATDFKKVHQASIIKSISSSSKYKVDKKKVVVKQPYEGRKSIVKRFKVIRSKKPTNSNRLRKCNIPCPVYRRYGKCKGKKDGTCIKVHNPDQVVLCTRFLQGACLDQHCLLSHKVSLEKMPTCKYFLDGLCSRDDCPYLHVKINSKADICKNFLEGYCKEGSLCDKRHQFLCPDFEKNNSCPRKRCPYPHGGNLVRKRKVSNSVAKKHSIKRNSKKAKTSKVIIATEDDENSKVPVSNRYYGECDSDKKGLDKLIETRRPKLGDLPSFIPFENI